MFSTRQLRWRSLPALNPPRRREDACCCKVSIINDGLFHFWVLLARKTRKTTFEECACYSFFFHVTEWSCGRPRNLKLILQFYGEILYSFGLTVLGQGTC